MQNQAKNLRAYLKGPSLEIRLKIILSLFFMTLSGGIITALEAQLNSRANDIIIIHGADVPGLSGYSIQYLDAADKAPGTYTGEIHAYSYSQAAGWSQIPFQIEELVAGAYFYESPPDSGLWEIYPPDVLDEDDEIVVDAADLGEIAPAGSVPDSSLVTAPCYRIEVTDPLTLEVGSFYLYANANLTQSFSQDYIANSVVNCEQCPDQRFEGSIDSDRYAVGFAEGNLSNLVNKIDGSNLDIFDLMFMWVDLTYPIFGCQVALPLHLDQGPGNNELVTSARILASIDGPVRCVMHLARHTDIDLLSLNTVTYQIIHFSRNQVLMPLSLSDFSDVSEYVCSLSFSLRFDFNAQAMLMNYYDEYNSDTIDGSQPSEWNYQMPHWRLATGDQTQGTVVITGSVPEDLITLGLIQPLYHDDPSYTDPYGRSTGSDAGHLGCSGFLVPDGIALGNYIQSYPGVYNVDQRITFLSHAAGNVGAAYQNRHDTPLTINAVDLTPPLPTLHPVALFVICLLISLIILKTAGRTVKS
ncbi:hypothetical protein ACFL27_10875 [candidate division CSSED10-310 bacterium]|uniref:Uncharacterized protein n=1 Tax=candidate division CSSED10-310 bacterium TaxID=2855610 RepID=A0ABV6YWV2_UNCC1